MGGGSGRVRGNQHFRDKEFTILHAAPHFIHGREDPLSVGSPAGSSEADSRDLPTFTVGTA